MNSQTTTASATTQPDGSYYVPYLTPGNYRVSVSAPGFKEFVRDGLVMRSAEVPRVDIVLEVGAVNESVTVSAAASLLNTETVVSCDPTAVFFENRYYNHSDHRTAGWIALDSCFPGSGNPHFFSEQLGEGLQTQDVFDVWLGWSNEPNRTEDVTGFFDVKIQALARHASQLTEGIRFFDEFLRKDAVRAGETIRVEHAEEFRVLDLS